MKTLPTPRLRRNTALLRKRFNTWGGYYSSNGQEWFSGALDEVRVTIGVGRYTTNFTPYNKPYPDL